MGCEALLKKGRALCVMATDRERREGAKQAARSIIGVIRFTEDFSDEAKTWLNHGIDMLLRHGLTAEVLRSVSTEHKDEKAYKIRLMLEQI
jgi:hypothetical protein